jgi:hypothetical protein
MRQTRERRDTHGDTRVRTHTANAQAVATLERALEELAQSNPTLTTDARRALAQLTARPAPAGRPPKDHGGAWSYSDSTPVLAEVTRIMRARDPDDLTPVIKQLTMLATRLLEQRQFSYTHPYRAAEHPLGLTDTQRRRLKQLARIGARPSEITRLLQRWRFDLSDRRARRLETLIRRH